MNTTIIFRSSKFDATLEIRTMVL